MIYISLLWYGYIHNYTMFSQISSVDERYFRDIRELHYHLAKAFLDDPIHFLSEGYGYMFVYMHP